MEVRWGDRVAHLLRLRDGKWGAIDRISDKAAQLASNELEHVLRIYGSGERRYREILRVVAALGEGLGKAGVP